MTTNKYIDVVIISSRGSAAKQISQEDRYKLERNLDFQIKRSEVLTTQTILDENTIKEETGEDIFNQTIEMGEEVLKDFDIILREMEDRGKNLTYVFDENKKPDLSVSVTAVFGSNLRDRITFEMYKKAIELRQELDLLLGQQQMDGSLTAYAS